MIHLASVHAASTRLAIALAGIVLFGAAATTRWRRPVPAFAIAVLCVVTVGWLFGATLVWGTRYPTQVRWSGTWTNNAGAWEWAALLLLAWLGTLSLGLALRSFAQNKHRRGWTSAALAGVAFLGWTAIVRYPVGVAGVAGAVGFAALYSTARAATVPVRGGGVPKRRLAVPGLLGTIVIGAAWALYALVWLVAGGEGQTVCNCWADQWGDWQYQAQFLTAVIGALAGGAAAVLCVAGRTRLAMMPAICALSAAGVWLTFLATA